MQLWPSKLIQNIIGRARTGNHLVSQGRTRVVAALSCEGGGSFALCHHPLVPGGCPSLPARAAGGRAGKTTPAAGAVSTVGKSHPPKLAPALFDSLRCSLVPFYDRSMIQFPCPLLSCITDLGQTSCHFRNVPSCRSIGPFQSREVWSTYDVISSTDANM
jgi:hypothetical protein